MPDLADLFTPIRLRNTTIRNRIVQSAHITGYVENGLPSDRHLSPRRCINAIYGGHKRAMEI